MRESRWDLRLKGANAFDTGRLVLASLVVLTHSYFLIDSNIHRDPLYVLSGGQASLGQIAVYMFFSISGFLVTRSFLLGRSKIRFAKKRVARIVPGFLVATVVGCLVIAPLAAEDVMNYFAAQSWSVLAATGLALKQVAVSGTLLTNPVHLVHGTLWSIRYEFDCYVAIAALGSMGLLSYSRAWFVLGSITLFLLGAWFLRYDFTVIDHGIPNLLVSSPHRWPELFPFFLVGSLFYIYKEKIPYSSHLAVVCIPVLSAGVYWGGMYWTLVFAGTYLLVYTCLSFSLEPVLLGKRTDISYGIYLYGWPIQQLILHFFGVKQDPLYFFSMSIFVTIPVAYISWIFVEAPSLRLVKSQHVKIPVG